jgi:hypothetical protein
MNIEAKKPGASKRVQRFEEVMKFNSDKAIEYQKQKTLSCDPVALDNLILRFKKIEQAKDRLFSLNRPSKPEKLTLQQVMNSNIRKEESGYSAYNQTKQLLSVQHDIAKEQSWFNPIAKVKAMLDYNKTFDEFQPIKKNWLNNKKELQQKVAETNKNRAMKYKRDLSKYYHKLQDLKHQIEGMKKEIASDFGSLDKAEFLARQRHADLEPQRKAAAEAQRQRNLEIAAQQRLARQREQLREALMEKRNELNNSSSDMSM